MTAPVPAFPSFRDITLEDKGHFNSRIAESSSITSEYTFTNFFVWRYCDRSQVTSINGNICVLARPENEVPYFFMPLGDNDIENTIAVCLSHTPRSSRIPEAFTRKYFSDKGRYDLVLDRNNSDYIYRTADLRGLKGKKYDGKRNKIKKLLKNNKTEYRELAQKDIAGCLELLNKWAKGRRSNMCFDGPIKEMLGHYHELSIKGAVVTINGAMEALTIGEKISDEYAVVYVELANPDIDGLSQYINQQFCMNEWGDIPYINREQDLGDPGLRKAKMSYHPYKMIDKFTVTLID